jgi:hypothetical protein
MATTTGQYAAPFLQPFGELLTNYAAGQLTQPQDISGMLPQVAGTNVLQQQALQQQATQAGLGSLQFNDQGQVLGAGQGTGIAGYQPYLQGAAGLSSPGAYQQYMSPYQQDVINTTLSNYDVQAQKGIAPLDAQAVGAGAFGGARQGIQKANYQSQSDLNRAMLQAQLQQQGFNQAQGQANTAFGQQMNLAQLQPQLANQGIQQLGQAGTAQQGYEQNILNALQQGSALQNQYPLQRLSGITSLFGNIAQATPGTPGQPIQTNPALAAAQAFAGIYGAMNPRSLLGGAGTGTSAGSGIGTGIGQIGNVLGQGWDWVFGTPTGTVDTNPPIDQPQAGDAVYTDYGQNAGDAVYSDYPSWW